MTSRKFIISLVSLVLILTILPAFIVFIVDPIQLYHNQITLKKTKYFKEQRHQNIGLVNKFLKRGEGNYTVIMGTSMSENFIPSKWAKKLNDGTKVLKLTMSGGRPLEQYTLLKKALETGKVKRVIWDIHWYYLLEKISQKDKNHDFPYKLYSSNPLTQANYYLFNSDYVKDSIKVFRGKVNWSKWTEDLDKLNYTMFDWQRHNLFAKNTSKKNIEKMNHDINKIKGNIALEGVSKLKYPDIDKYVLPLIKEYRKVEFDLFFPPYSTYFYAKSKVAKAVRFIYGKKYLVEKTISLKNVHIFGFDNLYKYTNNIYYYKDYGHYRSEINDYIMNSIINHKHILTKDNIDTYLNQMISNINQYNKVYYKNNTLNNKQLQAILYPESLNWKTDGIVKKKKNEILFSAKNIKKFAYLDSKFSQLSDINTVVLNIRCKKKSIKMFSISLKDGKEYAHFFIKPNKCNNNIYLANKKISKKSKNFTLNKINEITIRIYPNKLNSLDNIIIKPIKFYTKGKLK